MCSNQSTALSISRHSLETAGATAQPWLIDTIQGHQQRIFFRDDRRSAFLEGFPCSSGATLWASFYMLFSLDWTVCLSDLHFGALGLTLCEPMVGGSGGLGRMRETNISRGSHFVVNKWIWLFFCSLGDFIIRLHCNQSDGFWIITCKIGLNWIELSWS